MKLVVALLSVCLVAGHSAPRGAQIRLTKSGLNYAASLGVKKLHTDLNSKRINDFKGRKSDINWSATNFILSNVRIGNYNVKPIKNHGIRVTVSSISLNAASDIFFSYKKGWIKLFDNTNVKAAVNGLWLTLDFKFQLAGCKSGNMQCKPNVKATSCSASLSDLDLHFSGGLSWIYNILSKILEGKLKEMLRNTICQQGVQIIDKEANKALNTFQTRQKIDDKAWLDYSFEYFTITDNYIDLNLRGEFLELNNPKRSTLLPPTFDTSATTTRMVSVWLSDFLIDSVGRVAHASGLLKKAFSPNDKLIPKSIRPFLNTKSFEQLIPQLYTSYPNMPIQFAVTSTKPPTAQLAVGKLGFKIWAKVTIEVVPDHGKTIPIFYVNLEIDAVGSVSTRSEKGQLIVAGNVQSFKFSAIVGGSIIGHVNVPVENKSVQDMVKALVIDQANPILNRGFPIPEIRDLELQKTSLTIVKNAIRVDTDIFYDGNVKK